MKDSESCGGEFDSRRDCQFAGVVKLVDAVRSNRAAFGMQVRTLSPAPSYWTMSLTQRPVSRLDS